MSTLSSDKLTLAELAKRVSDGNVQTVAEVLNETNDFLTDAAWIEANQLTGHKGTIRQSLPSGTWRQINDGVTEESSKTRQITEGIGLLEALSKIDEEEVDISPNPTQFRQLEDEAFLEGMGQNFADTFIYGNTEKNPNQFHGLAPRLDDASYANVIDAGGSGSDLTSIYVVQWGPNRSHFIYPKNSQIGIEVNDKGLQLVDGDNSGQFYAYVTQFKLKVGLFVHDARCVWRIANIETPSSSSNSFDPDDLIRLLRKLPFNGRGAVIYANGDLLADLDVETQDKTNVNYSPDNPYGRPVTTFRGFPVRQVDAILSTESEIT
ncbi:MAG: hypothetical protein K9L56_14170 [Clostridiales bacterium]|nr:hypothetical protein [Clostridiales bacterium]